MNRFTGWMSASLFLVTSLLAGGLEAQARGRGSGSHSGGGHATASRSASKASSAPHASAHPSQAVHQAKPQQTTATTPQKVQSKSKQATPHTARSQTSKSRQSASSLANQTPQPAQQAVTQPIHPRQSATPRSYASRRGLRRYGGYAYGNRYANANGGIQAVVSQLRSAHSTLARLNRDYGGHRVQAMRAIRVALRQLGHSPYSYRRSTLSSTTGLQNPNANAVVARNLNANAIVARRPISQATSDSLMRRSRWRLQRAEVFMANHPVLQSRATVRVPVRHAISELNTALSIR